MIMITGNWCLSKNLKICIRKQTRIYFQNSPNKSGDYVVDYVVDCLLRRLLVCSQLNTTILYSSDWQRSPNLRTAHYSSASMVNGFVWIMAKTMSKKNHLAA